MKITIEKHTDLFGYFWLIKDENNKEIMSYCREVDLENREGGYTYEELLEKIKKHKEWNL